MAQFLLIIRMHEALVFSEFGRGFKIFPTDGADMWLLLAGVNPDVVPEALTGDEALVAVGAGEGALPCVLHHAVSAELVGVGVHLVTVLTRVGPLTGMRHQVRLELVRPQEPLLTVLTHKVLLSTVNCHMYVPYP